MFTLIELVIVIVILGFLSVMAFPRFVNLQSDLRIAVLEGTKGAIESLFSTFLLRLKCHLLVLVAMVTEPIFLSMMYIFELTMKMDTLGLAILV